MSHLPTSSAVVHDQEDTEGGARDTTERLLNVIARLESRNCSYEASARALQKGFQGRKANLWHLPGGTSLKFWGIGLQPN
ncbi:hypothetical protein QR680_015673 [Steinernema hermaphroditum]|uniref:Uncharacterized protein n=1 Tax=Steinernema hermaphroditum TaxID=289476 RepID=A0AA39HAS9_9BILA|nr:hypothetical protein QR680_015673 [Steinernema hermaphroditum]